MPAEVMLKLAAMQRDSRRKLLALKVDGGAAENTLMMQFQADILKTRIVRPAMIESTALGAGMMAGLAAGVWNKLDDIRPHLHWSRTFEPGMADTERKRILSVWQQVVKKT
jgi:glycerol kinase